MKKHTQKSIFDPRENQKTEKRNQEIYKLIQSGMTYNEVGLNYNITRERVRQIYTRKDLLEKQKRENPFWFVPVKVINALQKRNITLQEAFTMPTEELLAVRGLGIKSIEYIHSLKTV